MDREGAKRVYEEALAAGYPYEQAKARVFEFLRTGSVPEDPTAKFWDRQVKQESGGRQSAVSPKGAIGVAQVMPSTGPEAAALADLEWDPVAFKNDPVYNEAIGRAYMRKQLEDFGDERTALAAYNAGPGRVRKVLAGDATLPKETQDYIDKISPREAKPMTRNEQIRKIYQQVQEAGGGEEELRAELEKAFGKRPSTSPSQSKTESVAAEPVVQAQPTSTQTTSYGEGWMPAPGTKIDRLQQEVQNDMRGGALSRMLAGAERSVLGNIQGIRKLYNQAVGDDAEVAKINDQNQRAVDFWEQADPSGSGPSMADLGRFAADVGQFAAVPGGGATAAGRVAAGAATGGAQGLIAPTTAQDSQVGNALVGAGLGGALSGIGAALRRYVGSANPAKSAAVDRLRAQGVEIPGGARYDSPLNDALTKMARDEIPEASAGIGRRVAQLAGAPELSNEVLENTQNTVGRRIGSLYNDIEAPMDRDFVGDVIETGRNYLQGLDTDVQDPVMRISEDLLRRAQRGDPLTGAQYQKFRSQLGSLSTKGSSDEKQAFKALKTALDDLMDPMLDNRTWEDKQVLNAQYRLLKVLRSGRGIPAEGITPAQLANKIETAQNKGNVNPEVRQLLRDAATIAPRTRIGADESATSAHDVPRGIMEAVTRMMARGGQQLTRQGVPQAVISNDTVGVLANQGARNALLPILLRMNSGE